MLSRALHRSAPTIDQANKLIQEVAPIVDGKGGGRLDGAQGAGKDATRIGEALVRARELISL